MLPLSSTSIAWAAGLAPRPGIVCMSPQSAHDPAGTGVGAQVAHGDREAGRGVLQRGVVREREVRLRHADRQAAEAGLLEGGRPSLVPRAAAGRRRRRTPSARWRRIFSSIGASSGRRTGTSSAARPRPRPPRRARARPRRRCSNAVLTSAAWAPCSIASLRTSSSSSGVSVGELVHRHDGLQPEAVDDADVPGQVRGAHLDLGRAAVDVAAVVLERLHRRDEHDRARAQVADAAVMSKNFSMPMSEAKPHSVIT